MYIACPRLFLLSSAVLLLPQQAYACKVVHWWSGCMTSCGSMRINKCMNLLFWITTSGICIRIMYFLFAATIDLFAFFFRLIKPMGSKKHVCQVRWRYIICCFRGVRKKRTSSNASCQPCQHDDGETWNLNLLQADQVHNMVSDRIKSNQRLDLFFFPRMSCQRVNLDVFFVCSKADQVRDHRWMLFKQIMLKSHPVFFVDQVRPKFQTRMFFKQLRLKNQPGCLSSRWGRRLNLHVFFSSRLAQPRCLDGLSGRPFQGLGLFFSADHVCQLSVF